MHSSNEVKGLHIYSEEEKNNPYYSLIIEIDTLFQKRFPFGAINRIDIANELNLSNDELMKSLSALAAVGDELDDSHKRNIKTLADISQPILFGHCGFFTNYAIGYLKNKYPKVNIECMYVDSHAVLLLGRNPSSNTFDVNKFGKDAIVYDRFAWKCYLASKLPIIQNEKDIPFYQNVSNRYTNENLSLLINQRHYLAGEPEVITGKSSLEYDKALMAWVQEDQKRWNVPALTAPKIDSSIKVALDANEVKESLSKISKCSGWKFKEGIAWLDCKDENQSKRITEYLKATKATVVVSGQRQDNNQIYTVKCSHINLNKLKSLSDALNVKQSTQMAILEQFSFK
jgi:hypothetical protein